MNMKRKERERGKKELQTMRRGRGEERKEGGRDERRKQINQSSHKLSRHKTLDLYWCRRRQLVEFCHSFC